MDPMWFYDDAGDSEEWRAFRTEAQALEKIYLETRVALRDAEAALRTDAGNDALKARVEEFKKTLADLERQAAWLCSDVPVEVLLWGVPHG